MMLSGSVGLMRLNALFHSFLEMCQAVSTPTRDRAEANQV